MALKIRLRKKGRKKLAFYDIVVADERSPRDGRFIEKIGSYNPNVHPYSVIVNEKLALKWLLYGAKPTDTVKNIFHRLGIFLKKHLKRCLVKGLIDEKKLNEKFEVWKNLKKKCLLSSDGRATDL